MTIQSGSDAPLDIDSLWRGFRNRLLAFIRTRIPNPDEAEDILQDVFLSIHSGMGNLRDRGKLESWIFRIARNAIIDHYRKRRPLVPLDGHCGIAEEAPAEESAVSRLADSIREIIDSLPEPYKTALVLSESPGLDQKTIAGRLGISHSGAKSRVQRGRQMIRNLLLACCHFEFDSRGAVIDFYDRCCCCSARAGGRSAPSPR
jgi:RNA polymerase sigma-70 factor, ECF subfamily